MNKFIIIILVYKASSWLRFLLCTIVSTYLFSSVFAQMDSQQYFSLDDNSNSTNAVREKIDVVRISIVEGAPSLGEKAFTPDITNVRLNRTNK